MWMQSRMLGSPDLDAWPAVRRKQPAASGRSCDARRRTRVMPASTAVPERASMVDNYAQPAAVLSDIGRMAIPGFSGRFRSPVCMVSVHLERSACRAIPVSSIYTGNPGTSSYPAVSDIPDGMDLLVVFNPAQYVPDAARDVIEASPKYLRLQSGIRSDRTAGGAGLP